MGIKEGWHGRFFEDFEPGDVYRSHIGRTITQADNIWLTLLTGNTNQIHFNAHYASMTEFGRPLVNSAIIIATVAGLGVSDTSENGVALGWDEITLPNPLFEGDTLYSESEVLEKRESVSRPTMGVVRFRTRGIKQDGVIVIEYRRSVLIWKRDHAPERASFPEPRVNADGTPARAKVTSD
ncbi:MAG: MaoC family dehydratase [Solirubrobacterales bacterium]